MKGVVLLGSLPSWPTFLFAQVNGITLLGEDHQDVVAVLKELPVDVTMVCCRRTVPPAAPSELESLDLGDIELTEKVPGMQIWETNLNA